MFGRMTAPEAANFLEVTVQEVHRRIKKNNLITKKSMNRVHFDYDTSASLFNLKIKKQTIAFQIVKGGTGKTTLAHAIALRARLYGLKVLCIDLDQQANLTHAFGIKADNKPIMADVIKEKLDIKDAILKVCEGLFLLPSRIENVILDNTIVVDKHPLDHVYKKRLEQIKKDYDLIIIDCPPALGQSVAAVALASDAIIAPVAPEEFSLSGLKITHEEISNIEDNYSIKIPLRLILNKFDTRTSLSHEMLSILIQHKDYNKILYKTYVRASQEFPNSINKDCSIFDTLRATSAKDDIDRITREILQLKPASAKISLGNLESE